MIDDNAAEEQQEMSRLTVARQRIIGRVANTERRYLGLLRYALLIIATLLLVGAAFFLGDGLFRQFGSTEVPAKPATIQAEDVAPPPPSSQKDSPEKASSPERSLAAGIEKRTIAIYRAHFEPFQRKDDASQKDRAIVDAVWTSDLRDRVRALDGALLEGADGEPLAEIADKQRELLAVIEKASATQGLKKELEAYRSAAKVEVCNDEMRSTSRQIPYWDSSSTDCSNWDIYPYGCASTRTVPDYSFEKVCKMRLPDNLQNPLQLMARTAANWTPRKTAGA